MVTISAPVPLEYVKLFTDGACKGNPGPGGWAYVLKHPASGKEREDSGGEAHTTNNRMELMGVIRGLEVMRLPLIVDLYSDSQYVLKGLEQWMAGWKRGGWRTADGKPVKNKELWVQLDGLMVQAHAALPLGARALGAPGERALRPHGGRGAQPRGPRVAAATGPGPTGGVTSGSGRGRRRRSARGCCWVCRACR
jgi:ribonuclease HI